MAQPATAVAITRQRVTRILDALEDVRGIIDLYNDLGGQTFVARYLDPAQPGDPAPTDVTTAEYVTAISNLQQLQSWLDANRRASLAKLRVS